MGKLTAAPASESTPLLQVMVSWKAELHAVGQHISELQPGTALLLGTRAPTENGRIGGYPRLFIDINEWRQA